MSAYAFPIKTAILLFPLLALFLSSFFFIYQYRKYGTFILSRALILYSFIFYLLCAYFLVILPLPPIAEVKTYTTPYAEFSLLASIQRFLDQTVLNLSDPSTYLPAMKQGVFLEPIFNVFLTIPFGIYLRYYFKLNLRKTLLASFCLSLFFELTQLSGLYFIYPRPYRLFDVNDLFANTLGGVIGYWLTPIFTFLLPTRDAMDQKSYVLGQRVTFLRRLAAVAIDWGIINLISILIMVGIRAVTKNVTLDFRQNYWFFVLQVLSYFVLLAYLLKGQTIGKKIVRIKVVEEEDQRVRLSTLFKRYGLLYLIYFSIARLNFWVLLGMNSQNKFLVVISLIVLVLILILQTGFYLNLAWGILRRKRQFFYETRTHSYNISVIPPKES